MKTLCSHLVETQMIRLVQTKFGNLTEFVINTSQVVPAQSRTPGNSYTVLLLPSRTLFCQLNHLIPADCQDVPNKHSISIKPEGAYSHLPMDL